MNWVVGAILMVQVMRLFAQFKPHQAIFSEFAQTDKVRYALWLLVGVPFVLQLAPVVMAFLIGLACAALVWYWAHEQYHFFDAQGTARVKPAQRWLASVEMLALMVLAYGVLHLVLTVALVLWAQ
ncbi:MAG: hypothetical protein ACRCV6_05655 [Formosimonas sp.]